MRTTKIDATNQTFGRLASKIAFILRGKSNPSFKPNEIPKEKVIVKNLDKVKFTGKKKEGKIYYRHSKYPGSIKKETLKQRWDKDPLKALKRTVFDMLPKNKIRKEIIKNLTAANTQQ